jgi:hypothetical protein
MLQSFFGPASEAGPTPLSLNQASPMKLILRRCALVLSIAAVSVFAPAQRGTSVPGTVPPDQDEGARLPSGKLQRDEILKAEYEQNLKDAAKLVDLAEELKEDLEKNDQYVLSMSTLKKTDDIEKLVKRIRSRMRHN